MRLPTNEEIMLMKELASEPMYCREDRDRIIYIANTQDNELISFVSRVLNGKARVITDTIYIRKRQSGDSWK